MNLTLDGDKVVIELEPMERVWGCHVSQQIEVPLNTIESIRLERPATTWRALRAPGTYWPGLIKAGTYYTERGREFWYAQHGKQCICLDIAAGYYKRIVLGSVDAESWYATLQTERDKQMDSAA